MKKNLIIAIGLMLLLPGIGLAQEVFSSSGNTFQTPEATLSFTLGEPVTATFSNSEATLTHGFQQNQRDPNQTDGTAAIQELPALPWPSLLTLGLAMVGLVVRQSLRILHSTPNIKA